MSPSLHTVAMGLSPRSAKEAGLASKREQLLERARRALGKPKRVPRDALALITALSDQLRAYESQESRADKAEQDAINAAVLKRDAEERAVKAEREVARMQQELRTLQSEVIRLQNAAGGGGTSTGFDLNFGGSSAIPTPPQQNRPPGLPPRQSTKKMSAMQEKIAAQQLAAQQQASDFDVRAPRFTSRSGTMKTERFSVNSEEPETPKSRLTMDY